MTQMLDVSNALIAFTPLCMHTMLSELQSGTAAGRCAACMWDRRGTVELHRAWHTSYVYLHALSWLYLTAASSSRKDRDTSLPL